MHINVTLEAIWNLMWNIYNSLFSLSFLFLTEQREMEIWGEKNYILKKMACA